MTTHEFRSAAATAVARLGALAFAVSALWAAFAFVDTFALVPEPWSREAGVRAVARNAFLFGAFALHHSTFARAPVKQWLTRHLPPPLERSLFVWVASALLAATIALWAPVPGLVWHLSGVLAALFTTVQATGLLLTLVAVRRLDAASLAGLRAERTPQPLHDSGLYGFVRHPIYFAWLLMVWATPVMTGSRLTFAALTTLYLILAVPLEERSLRRDFGPAYDEYRRTVRWRMLPGIY